MQRVCTQGLTWKYWIYERKNMNLKYLILAITALFSSVVYAASDAQVICAETQNTSDTTTRVISELNTKIKGNVVKGYEVSQPSVSITDRGELICVTVTKP